MPDLLLELFSEEIPARMQAAAAQDLQKLVTNALVDRGLTYEGATAYVTPRRLTLHIVGLPVRQSDQNEDIKGPRVGSPEQALAGFLKKAGLTSIDQAKIESDGKKGEIYVAHIHRAGKVTTDVLRDILPAIIRSFPWPKSMRWGDTIAHPDSLRWVRPLHSIVCTFGPETEEPEIVDFEVGGIRASNVTYGHRFMAPAAIKVRRFSDYIVALEKAKVVLDPARRREIILADAKTLAFAHGLELVEDEGLLNEVAGLVEWPVVLMGTFDQTFLDIPGEVVRATIRANQKCFVLRDPKTNKLAPGFILTANIEASDGGAAIAAGNGRVVRARLSDALYFWQTDQKDLPDFGQYGSKLDQRMAKLRALNIVFHEKLGTQGERVDRITALAKQIAPLVKANEADAARAAELCKADLMTEVVGEFPEVQGLMGRRYAELQGENADVSAAIEEHYKPQGPSDFVPKNPVSIAVALADKIDTLFGFDAINERATGSKDPFALRRAALGITRLVLENQLTLSITELFDMATIAWHELCPEVCERNFESSIVKEQLLSLKHPHLLAFFHDRLKVYLRDKGIRHDILDAVISPEADDLLEIQNRAQALQAFLETPDGTNLLAVYKRAANILKAEEKKFPDQAASYTQPGHVNYLQEHAEKALGAALDRSNTESREALAKQDFAAALHALAKVHQPADAFFTDLMVNAEDAALRLNRLRLLGSLRSQLHAVADFSKIAG